MEQQPAQASQDPDSLPCIGPVLIVCFTNHALDQFLEGLVAAGLTNLVRVGGRYSAQYVSHSTAQHSTPRLILSTDDLVGMLQHRSLFPLSSTVCLLLQAVLLSSMRQGVLSVCFLNVCWTSDCLKSFWVRQMLAESSFVQYDVHRTAVSLTHMQLQGQS